MRCNIQTLYSVKSRFLAEVLLQNPHPLECVAPQTLHYFYLFSDLIHLCFQPVLPDESHLTSHPDCKAEMTDGDGKLMRLSVGESALGSQQIQAVRVKIYCLVEVLQLTRQDLHRWMQPVLCQAQE